MDKYEYKVRAEEIKALIAEGEFAEAVKIADTIDWRRVKSVMMLCTISDLYKINRRFQESKDILLMAYERHPGGRLIVYSLCELSIKMGEFVQAIEYYKEFVQIAPKDTGRYILQYKLYEAQDVSLEERIAVLEEFKKRDYREKWAYELAYLYHRVGLETKCTEECDEMILWFGEGRYVLKALELKMLHQPLSASQQEKYLAMKRELEQMAEEEEQVQEEVSTEPEEEVIPEEEPEEASVEEVVQYQYEEVPQPEEEEDFRVKTVDLGQYNTINLQRALAESMREILGEEKKESEEEEPVEEESSTMDSMTEAIVAPLLQEPGDVPQVQQVSFASFDEPEEMPVDAMTVTEQSAMTPVEAEPISEPAPIPEPIPIPEPVQITESVQILEPVPIPEPPIATEEVFFEEDVKDILLQDTKEINVGSLGDTKEISPKRKVIYPKIDPQRRVGFKSIPVEEAPVEPVPAVVTPAVQTMVQPSEQITAQGPSLMKQPKPSGFEQMLSQEYDGQISMVVPNRSDIEKQITGQMNITDIMAEWERMKRENEEKRKEDVRKRVQQHTGNMFSEFDEAMKSGVLEQLEKAVVEAILKESAQKTLQPDKLTAEQLTDIVKKVERKESLSTASNVVDGIRNMENAAQTLVSQVEPITGQIEIENISDSPVMAEQTTAVEQPVVKEQTAVTEQQAVPEPLTVTEEAEVTEAGAVTVPEVSAAVVEELTAALTEPSVDNTKIRAFSEEEKELFGRFAHSRKAKEQIIHTMDTISMDSYSGNVIITGEEEAGTLDLAKNLVRMMQMTDHNFSGKVAKISGDTLNKKDVQSTLEKLTDGALIIEHATEMSSGTSTDLVRELAKEGKGIFVIMEGKKDEMNIFLRKNYPLMRHFNARIDIESLDDQALVEYAKQYAEEMEYSIDELGILALHTRIADMQTSDHEVTVAEVRDLVDDAIYFADKKNPKHFFDVLFGKRYDEEDMIILREKDFMHY